MRGNSRYNKYMILTYVKALYTHKSYKREGGDTRRKMTELKTMRLLLITATILLSFAATASANADYSYNLTTDGGTIVATETHDDYSPNDSMANQYSLYMYAVNSDNASCNHSFSEGGSEIKSATDATYYRCTSGILGCLIGGASLIENIGGTSGTADTYYQGAIGFETDADILEKFSSDGLSRNGADTYYNISAAKGYGRFTAGLDSEEVTKTASGSGWNLVSEKKTSSRIGVRSGAYNFTARYHVNR